MYTSGESSQLPSDGCWDRSLASLGSSVGVNSPPCFPLPLRLPALQLTKNKQSFSHQSSDFFHEKLDLLHCTWEIERSWREWEIERSWRECTALVLRLWVYHKNFVICHFTRFIRSKKFVNYAELECVHRVIVSVVEGLFEWKQISGGKWQA